jgi:Rrf2 family transcriptional regulator, cysteine metabolism repressor
MALLNRKVDYALLVLSFLRHHAGGGSAREIALRFGLSRAFVANILKELCHKGYVTSHRGVKGGYALAPQTESANLADFIEALDSSFRLAECNQPTEANGCDVFHRCPVRGPIATVHGRIINVLRQVTLGELFHPEAQPSTVGLPLLMPDKVTVG